MLRCTVPDRPGALATLAGTVGESGGDIHAIEVVDTADGHALDDLVVWVPDGEALGRLVERIRGLDGFELVHTGPSRGHPGDAVARMGVALGALLDGSMTEEHALSTLVGGILRAASVAIVPARDAPAGDAKTLVLPFAERALVVHRDYRFTDVERERAVTILRTCAIANAVRAAGGA